MNMEFPGFQNIRVNQMIWSMPRCFGLTKQDYVTVLKLATHTERRGAKTHCCQGMVTLLTVARLVTDNCCGQAGFERVPSGVFFFFFKNCFKTEVKELPLSPACSVPYPRASSQCLFAPEDSLVHPRKLGQSSTGIMSKYKLVLKL